MAIDPIHLIRDKTKLEEIDSLLVKYCLKDYASPRAVVTRLLKNDDLIQVKKGIYVFGDRYRRRLISVELLANRLYGPSYISDAFALQYYGLIPEAVYEITNITTKRNKRFMTPLGLFTYRHLNLKAYQIGITLVPAIEGYNALMATPEKALADFIYFRKEKVNDVAELIELLLENYRIYEEELIKFDLSLLCTIAAAYKYPAISLLSTAIREIKGE